MTNNPTIDGLDRETLAFALGFKCHGHKNRTDQQADKQNALDKIRALLDAPVVERQEPYKWLVKCCYGPVSKIIENADESMRDSMESARQYYGSEREIDAGKANKLVYISPGEWFAIPLYREPPDVAALQSTIAQLRQHKNDYMEAAEETRKALSDDISQLQARIGELESELHEDDEEDRRTVFVRSNTKVGQRISMADMQARYASPAPVAVVLPDKMERLVEDFHEGIWVNEGECMWIDGYNTYFDELHRKNQHLNACLDATAALNTVHVGELDPAQRLALARGTDHD